METEISRIAPFQAAKLAAVLYFIMGLVFAVPIMSLSLFFSPPEGAEQNNSMGIVFILILPFLYALMGFIFTPIMCWIYNLVAKYTGGLKFSLRDTQDA